jgi:hypothetical protein
LHRASLLQRSKPAALHNTRPPAALQCCPAPLPTSAQHAGPSSAARRAGIPRSDRSLPLDDTAAIKTRLPVSSLRALALPQDAARLAPASSPATCRCPTSRIHSIAAAHVPSAAITASWPDCHCCRQARASRARPRTSTAFPRL